MLINIYKNIWKHMENIYKTWKTYIKTCKSETRHVSTRSRDRWDTKRDATQTWSRDWFNHDFKLSCRKFYFEIPLSFPPPSCSSVLPPHSEMMTLWCDLGCCSPYITSKWHVNSQVSFFYFFIFGWPGFSSIFGWHEAGNVLLGL